MARKSKTPVAPAPPEFPKVIETFRNPSWSLREVTQSGPSCFNDNVSVKRYRITAEEIPEPTEVLVARLQELWDTTDNHHHWTPLKAAAAKLGAELVGRPGNKRRP